MENLYRLFYECSGVSIDTRTITDGVMYIALKGENFDGNVYAQQAIEKGAKFAIVDNMKYADNTSVFYVESGLLFLQKLAEYHRNSFNIPVIGITGTNGKTTTKELVAAVLNKKYSVLFTQGNLNNHIGVPLTLLQLNKSHDIAIIEMGASKIGDIKELTDIAHPTHGIITNVGHAHLEGFGSPENIIKTKTELYTAIEEVKGHLFCNNDDETLINKASTTNSSKTYGASNSADVYGQIVNLSPRLSFVRQVEEYTSPIIN